VEALKTTSRKYGDDFIINGQKIFITKAHKADYLLTLLRTDARAAKRSKSLSLFFENARVPAKNMLGALYK
jgi:acyl-CoA dehydrogenase